MCAKKFRIMSDKKIEVMFTMNRRTTKKERNFFQEGDRARKKIL